MSDQIFSVAIPYRQRLENIRGAFASLAEQTLDHTRFEVVVGAIDYSPDYVSLCNEFAGRLSVITVMADGPWNYSRARNLAIRQATGEILVVMDADMMLPTDFLENVYQRYYADGQDICLVGQMVGYRPGATYPRTPSQEHHRSVLNELKTWPAVRVDPRLNVAPALIWSAVWAGLVTIPMATVRRHDLSFDENFSGWGIEDVEWGYRIWRNGIPVAMREDVYGVHQPHPPEPPSATNLNYFLRKWPTAEVELWRAFGATEAAECLEEAAREVGAVGGAGGLGVVSGVDTAGDSVLIVGVALDERGCPSDPAAEGLLAADGPGECLPLIGVALPYLDRSVERCFVLERVEGLPPRYRDAVLAEAERVAHAVVLAPAMAADGGQEFNRQDVAG
jgi:GT2 family glycosyltransferase